MDKSKIFHEYDMLKSTLNLVCPFVSSLLGRVRIVVSDEVGTAGIDKFNVLYISPKFWGNLDWASKAWVLAHETLHIAFYDIKRLGNREPKIWNIVCDAMNNDIISSFMKRPIILDHLVTLETIAGVTDESLNELKSKTKDELYNLVKSKTLVLKTFDEFILEAGDGIGKGHEIQPGDPEIYKDGRDSGDPSNEELWKQKIASAFEAQRSIGQIPSNLSRIVDRILASIVPWNTLLKNFLRIGFGKTVVSSWKRQSRKNPDLPGMTRFTRQDIWCLIDTSGSINKTTLAQFLGEVYAVVSFNSVKIVCWDSEAYDILKCRNKGEVISKISRSLMGGGGTLIAPALTKTLHNMRPMDSVIVFTDGYIGDINSVSDLTLKLAMKSSVAIFVSTEQQHNIKGWKCISIKPARLEVNMKLNKDTVIYTPNLLPITIPKGTKIRKIRMNGRNSFIVFDGTGIALTRLKGRNKIIMFGEIHDVVLPEGGKPFFPLSLLE